MATEYRIRSAAWEIAPRVVAFRGREGVSDLYRFDVGVLWTTAIPFSPEDAVGEVVTLEIDRDNKEPHRWNGVIEEVELVLEEGSSSYWRVSFGPRLRRLAFTEHSRVFTDASVPDIIRAVLTDEGLAGNSFTLGLTASYPSREHVCQYRESSLDFVRRLAERDGIHWHFNHGEEEETLAFVDDARAAEHSVESVRYVALAGDDAVSGEALVHFRAKRTMLPKSVRLHDYDPMRPRLDVTGQAAVVSGPGGEIVRWGEHVLSPDEAGRYARVRSEELVSKLEVFHGHGVVVGLRPGKRFGLSDHPALDGDYYVTGLRHRAKIGNQSKTVLSALGFEELIGLDTQYRVDVDAVGADVVYRAPSSTVWPRVPGVVTAFVDGAGSSSYAQIDAEGRYKVNVHFDEGDLVDGSRSTWVRMLQPHGGLPEGQHFPLRKGTEVALIFLGGDPDRPFILGVSPNPEKPSPVQRGNFTQNVIQTGGRNRLELEDIAGGQYITESTPTATSYLHLGAGAKNLAFKTDGRGRIYTGGNYDVDVDVNRTEDVDATVTETYQSTQTLTVTGPVTETLRTSLTWGILGPVTHTWVGPFTETVDGHVSENFGATLTTTVNAAMTTLTYSGGLTVIVAGDVTERFTASQSTTVNGTLTLIVGSNVTEHYASVNRHIKGTYYLGVAGTYKVLTPNMVMQSPNWNVLSNIAKKFISQSFKMDSSKFTMELVKTSTGVVSNSINGVSLSATGVSLSLAGTCTSKGSNKLSLDGPVAWAAGIYIYTGALMLLNGGPEVE